MIINKYNLNVPDGIENPIEWAGSFCTGNNSIGFLNGNILQISVDDGVCNAPGVELIESVEIL